MSEPTRASLGGRAFLDLRNKAAREGRPVDELLQLYLLECFLARLAGSRFAEQFVLKGGVLLAAFGERRPTRDIDLQAQDLSNHTETVRMAIIDIATLDLDDGVEFETRAATAAVIRDEDAYAGVRVSMKATLATAQLHFHVDVSVGDPITPPPQQVAVPLLLGGEVIVRGYPLSMVLAEKIVTALTRGTVNTGWRDFADVFLLIRHHPIDGSEFTTSIREVAAHRGVELVQLGQVLEGYGAFGQQKWTAWRKRQQLEDRLPESFSVVVSAGVSFADPVISGAAAGRAWSPHIQSWA